MSTPIDTTLSAVWGEAIAASPFLAELFWHILIYALGFALIGVVLAVFIMLMFHRRRWLRRQHRWWNVGAKLTYLVVLIALPLAGAVGGALWSVQRSAEQFVDTVLMPELTDRMPDIRRALVTHVGPLAGETLITARDLVQPLVDDFMYRPQDDSFFDNIKARVFNGIIVKAAAVALTHAFQQAMSVLPDMVSAHGSQAQGELTRFSVAVVVQALSATAGKVDFSDLDRTVPEMFGDAMHRQIRSLFKGVYLGLVIKLALVAMLIGAELLVYFKHYLPRRMAVVPVS
jgi:hypothetical protein